MGHATTETGEGRAGGRWQVADIVVVVVVAGFEVRPVARMKLKCEAG